MSDSLSLFLVNATFVFLVAAALLTWVIVSIKSVQQRRLTRETLAFTRDFEQLRGLPTASALAKQTGPAARVASAGVASWQSSARGDDGRETKLDVRVDLLERTLSQQLQRERRQVETGLPVLASVGSTSPFIGLFGTVLGIIHALTAISSSGSASLDVVAGPIGEALVATAVGIAVAVPAVLAYNYFLRRLKTFAADLEELADEFVGHALKEQLRQRGAS